MRPLKTLSALTLVVVVCGAGCVLPDQFSKMQKDVAELHDELKRIEREQAESAERLDQLAAVVAAPREQTLDRSEFADIKIAIDEISRQQSILDERLIESNRRLDRLSQSVEENRERVRQVAVVPGGSPGNGIEDPSGGAGLAGAGAAGGAAAGGPGSAMPSADDLYHTAYADFSKGNYALAISGFEEYAGRYPDSDRADNALYWIGECYFSQGSYAVAVGAFDRMLERYPESDRAPAANLKKGLAYLNQNQVRQAVVQLRYVEDQHPDTDEARVAREKLASLGAQ